jgi:hypothetical protein
MKTISNPGTAVMSVDIFYRLAWSQPARQSDLVIPLA